MDKIGCRKNTSDLGVKVDFRQWGIEEEAEVSSISIRGESPNLSSADQLHFGWHLGK